MINRRRSSLPVAAAALVAILCLPFLTSNAVAFSLGVAGANKTSKPSSSASTTAPSHRFPSVPSSSLLLYANAADEGTARQTQQMPLCDLQTFLRMCDLVDSGGAAKTAIQNSECQLNGAIETRRSKKLFPGDAVTFGAAVNVDVETEVNKRGYVYKPKVKKAKPSAKVDADGNLEFGGRFRSEEWRKERKAKKAERKAKNKDSSK